MYRVNLFFFLLPFLSSKAVRDHFFLYSLVKDPRGPTPSRHVLADFRDNVTFTDDFSKHAWIFLMRQKTEVFTHFQKLKREFEKTTGWHA